MSSTPTAILKHLICATLSTTQSSTRTATFTQTVSRISGRLLKRALGGTYISVETDPPWTPMLPSRCFASIIATIATTRDSIQVMSQITGKRLTYATLTGKEILN